MIAYLIEVYGKVQGVGFRYYTKQKADELGLTGYVKNNLNGTVSVFVQGNAEEVLEFIKWCQQGPDSSNVEKLEYVEKEVASFEEFKIKR